MSGGLPVVVMGAGPAGLAAAWVLAGQQRPVEVLERSDMVGGLARTVVWRGYRFDIGGHRFFTRYDRVQALWTEVLGDDFLVRPRMSRIVYRGKLFDYPLRPANALRSLGPVEAARCMASFGRARLRPRGHERTFQEWVSNRFGDRLFEIFFRTYTEKVWGIPCTELSADWAAQRIKNLSLGNALKATLLPDRGARATSLIEHFHYPRLGPGMMYDKMAEGIETRGGSVRMRTSVVSVQRDGFDVTGVVIEDATGPRRTLRGSHYLSSIPLTILVEQLDPPAPPEVLAAARSLTFRDMIVANLVVEGADLFPDTWVYVHSPDLQVGRIQNYGNWSPEMVPEPGRSALGLEYFATRGDALWKRSDADIVAMATEELRRTGLCRPKVLDGLVVRAPQAYPVYRMGYERHLQVVVDFVRKLRNLQAMGRYGMFKYNNSDHSILTAMLSVENIDGAGHDVWAVNSDESYHEEKPAGG